MASLRGVHLCCCGHWCCVPYERLGRGMRGQSNSNNCLAVVTLPPPKSTELPANITQKTLSRKSGRPVSVGANR